MGNLINLASINAIGYDMQTLDINFWKNKNKNIDGDFEFW